MRYYFWQDWLLGCNVKYELKKLKAVKSMWFAFVVQIALYIGTFFISANMPSKTFIMRITSPFAVGAMLASALLISADILSLERQSKTAQLVLTTKSKRKLLRSKLSFALFVPSIIYLFYVIYVLLISILQYGSQTYTFILRAVLLNCALIAIVSSATYLVSFVSSAPMAPFLFCAVLMGVEKILSNVSFLPDSFRTILSFGNLYDMLRNIYRYCSVDIFQIKIFNSMVDLIFLCRIRVYIVSATLLILAFFIIHKGEYRE